MCSSTNKAMQICNIGMTSFISLYIALGVILSRGQSQRASTAQFIKIKKSKQSPPNWSRLVYLNNRINVYVWHNAIHSIRHA